MDKDKEREMYIEKLLRENIYLFNSRNTFRGRNHELIEKYQDVKSRLDQALELLRRLSGDLPRHKSKYLDVEINKLEERIEKLRRCPKCDSVNVATERRIDGDSYCANCYYKAKTELFDNPVMSELDKLREG